LLKKCIGVILSLIITITYIPVGAFASMTNIQTEVKPVDLDGVVLADSAKYKDMDTTFLMNYTFGSTLANSAIITFSTVADMKNSTLANLKEGNTIRTKGYYEVEDGGAAVYKIKIDSEPGAIELKNGLYACIMSDTYTDRDGNLWLVANVLQYGAMGNGKITAGRNIEDAVSDIGSKVNENESIYRGIVYIPEGEYKCDNLIHISQNNINIVGDGNKSILFTDNDYRRNEGYSEHFIEVWGSKNLYFADFTIEAREVDLYNYMRQFSLLYSEDIYVYNVDMIIPQDTYNSYYFEDKQYSNFCCYTGNKNITADNCKMVQMSGTYRGANVGVMDIWSAGEENITIMNCDLYGNARDEQIGIFSTNKSTAYVRNVDFINNTIHSYEPRYTDIIGNATMRFTLGYTDSNDVNDIRIAGNHFVVECDSKFMTFGNISDCVIEDNIIEFISTYKTWSMLFDSGNTDSSNVLIQNNEIFITSNEDLGIQNLIGGKLTFKSNRILADEVIASGILGEVVEDNEFILLEYCGKLAEISSSNQSFKGNSIYSYAGCSSDDGWVTFVNSNETQDLKFNENTIYDYKRNVGARPTWSAISKINTKASSISFCDNRMYFPNTIFTSANGGYTEFDKDEQGNNTKFNNRIFYYRAAEGNIVDKITCKGNILQGCEGYISYGDNSNTEFEFDNTLIGFEEKESDTVSCNVDIVYNGKTVENISTTSDVVDLSEVVYIPTAIDENGNVTSKKKATDRNVKWYTSVEGIATVSDTGIVKRHLYGKVHVYAVPLDGGRNYAECVINFEKKKATDIVLEENVINLEPGLNKNIEYIVLPENEASQEVIWSSANEQVATVHQKGIVKAVGIGETDIICKTIDGSISKKIRVKVSDITVKKINMSEEWKQLPASSIGSTYQVNVATYYPDNAKNKGISKWESTDETILKVSDTGLVTIKASGVASIKAYSMDGSCYGTTELYVSPTKVNNLVVNNVARNTASLKWNEVENCYGYYVYMWNSATAEWKLCNQQYITDTSYNISGLEAGDNYKFCVRAFISNWRTGERVIYESPDSIVEFETLTYQPVTNITSSAKVFSLTEGYDTSVNKSSYLEIKYSPTDANWEGLELEYYISDESIAKIMEIEADGNIRMLFLKGLRCGTTTLTVRANDGYGASIEIPIGVVSNSQVNVSSISPKVEYGSIQFDFNGLQDEAGITGYMVRKKVGYRYENVKYIEKNGRDTYHFSQTDGTTDGAEEIYVIFPCYKNGENYFFGWSSADIAVTFPEKELAGRVELNDKPYMIVQGKKLNVDATIWSVKGGKASVNVLDWYTPDSQIISIERKGVNGQKDCAVLTGNKLGATTINVITTDDTYISDSQRVIVIPNRVKNITTNASTDSVTIKWNKYEGVSGYRIYRLEDDKDIFIADVINNYFVDKNKKEGTTYKYKIVPYIYVDSEKYEGVYSDVLFATTKLSQNTNKEEEKPAVNSDIYSINGYKYEVTGQNTVSIAGVVNKNIKGIVIKATVKINGKNYKVTEIAPAAFKDCNKLKRLTIGKYVNKIGKDSIKNINKKAVVIVPKTKESKYTKLFTKTTGYKSTMKIMVKKGTIYKFKGYKYKVLDHNKVAVCGCVSKKKKHIVIKNTIKAGGRNYMVTKIEANSFKNNRKIVKVTLGKNIVSIGKNAFKNIDKNTVFKSPKSRLKRYKKMLKARTGFKKSMKIS